MRRRKNPAGRVVSTWTVYDMVYHHVDPFYCSHCDRTFRGYSAHKHARVATQSIEKGDTREDARH